MRHKKIQSAFYLVLTQMVGSVRARAVGDAHGAGNCSHTGYRTELARQASQSIDILPLRREYDFHGRDTPSLFTTFTHVMKADAESQERLLTLICDTLERALLYSDNSQVGFHCPALARNI
jgi:hypothetical protein